jgi:integrase
VRRHNFLRPPVSGIAVILGAQLPWRALLSRVVKPSVSAGVGRIGRRPRSPELRLGCAKRPRAVAVRDVRQNRSGADHARHALLMADRAKKLGVPDVTTHSFRKTVATRIDDEGLSAWIGAHHLGHTDVSMTQDRYMTQGRIHTQVMGSKFTQGVDPWGRGP